MVVELKWCRRRCGLLIKQSNILMSFHLWIKLAYMRCYYEFSICLSKARNVGQSSHLFAISFGQIWVNILLAGEGSQEWMHHWMPMLIRYYAVARLDLYDHVARYWNIYYENVMGLEVRSAGFINVVLQLVWIRNLFLVRMLKTKMKWNLESTREWRVDDWQLTWSFKFLTQRLWLSENQSLHLCIQWAKAELILKEIVVLVGRRMYASGLNQIIQIWLTYLPSIYLQARSNRNLFG